MDWSDHALWWPARNHWLTRTRSTLDQYGVAADAILHFTPMHKTLRVQLPDMRFLDCRVDFSVKTFNAVINLCKELGKSSFLSDNYCSAMTKNAMYMQKYVCYRFILVLKKYGAYYQAMMMIHVRCACREQLLV